MIHLSAGVGERANAGLGRTSSSVMPPESDLSSSLKQSDCTELRQSHHDTSVKKVWVALSAAATLAIVEAAMIGYVQTDTPERWQATLQSNLVQQRNDLQMDRIIKSVSFEESFPLEWISCHRRSSLPALSLFHIVLDCRRNQSSA